MRIAVCDDDEQEILRLMELVTEYQSIHGQTIDCHSFHNSTDFLCTVKGGDYDLILMDILMPGTNGIQAAQELRTRDSSVRLVFISASPEFAVESYNIGAYHYLLKPVAAAAFYALLDRVNAELSAQTEQGFVLKSREGVVRVPFGKIEYVEVINKTVSFHIVDGTIREVAATLADYEEMLLCRPEFFKPHRSYLINLNHIQEIGTDGIVTQKRNKLRI